jgi:hypothetical protein
MFYPLIITYTSDEYYEVNIPDFKLELGAYGETEEEAIEMAKSVIVSELELLEKEGKKYPKSSNIKDLTQNIKENQYIVRLDFNLEYEKSLIKQVFKSRTVTLPTWLDMLAKNKNLNFSQILQKALKKELNIK